MNKIFKKFYNIFNINAYLISFPKSGNTWLRFIFANIIKEIKSYNLEVDFFSIENYIPTLNNNIFKKSNVVKPVIVKTHNIGLKQLLLLHILNKKLILIIRQPVDVMISYYLYSIKLENKKYLNFSEFIRSGIGIKWWINHTNKYFNKSNYVIYYDNLEEKKFKEINKIKYIFHYLCNVKISDTMLETAFKRSSKKNMKRLEEYKKSITNNDLIYGTPYNKEYSFVSLKKRKVKVLKEDKKYIYFSIKRYMKPDVYNKIFRNIKLDI